MLLVHLSCCKHNYHAKFYLSCWTGSTLYQPFSLSTLINRHANASAPASQNCTPCQGHCCCFLVKSTAIFWTGSWLELASDLYFTLLACYINQFHRPHYPTPHSTPWPSKVMCRLREMLPRERINIWFTTITKEGLQEKKSRQTLQRGLLWWGKGKWFPTRSRDI